MSTIVHSIAAIENLLRRGLTPITDNQEALIELGFVRAYPQIARGYESRIWERSAVHRPRTRSRILGRERAFLESAVPTSR